jgi:hypothetical protein
VIGIIASCEEGVTPADLGQDLRKVIEPLCDSSYWRLDGQKSQAGGNFGSISKFCFAVFIFSCLQSHVKIFHLRISKQIVIRLKVNRPLLCEQYCIKNVILTTYFMEIMLNKRK